MNEWIDLTGDGSVLALKYSFGFGTANTLAARLDDGKWLVISPSCKTPEGVFEELAKKGDVSALIAPNAFHHLGQLSWRERFPNAKSYAPVGSHARLKKQSPQVTYLALDELKVPDRVNLFVPQGMKADDMIAHVTTKAGAVWFGGDLISNTVKEDISLLPRLMFQLLGGGTGYRFNSVPSMVYLRDKAAWKADMLRAIEAAPPFAMVPGHGTPVRDPDTAAQTRAILA